MTTPDTLRTAAQAVLDRWYSPQWEWTKHGPTADLMHALRAALAPEPHIDGWPLYSGLPPPAASGEPAAWIEGPHGAIRMNMLWKLDPMPPQSVAWSIPLYTAQPAPMAPIRTALQFIDKYSVSTIRTNSKDLDDWADDMAYVGKVAREALAAQPAPAPAASGEPDPVEQAQALAAAFSRGHEAG